MKGLEFQAQCSEVGPLWSELITRALTSWMVSLIQTLRSYCDNVWELSEVEWSQKKLANKRTLLKELSDPCLSPSVSLCFLVSRK